MRSLSSWERSVLLLLVTVAAYFQTWAELWPHWEHKDATYTHGTLVAAVAIWLTWRTRTAVASISPSPSPIALLIVAFLSFAWLLAARANLFIVHASLWPVLAFAVIWAGVGRHVASRFAFPLAFLYFAIPIWEFLKPPLQAIASVTVGFLTELAGVPAIVEGPRVVLPSETIYIALECSGAHFLCVALAVGALAGELRRDTIRTRLLLMVLGAALSIAFNSLRIVLIVLAYLNESLRQALETVGHLTFGWWVFALDLVVFYLVLRRLPPSKSPEPDFPIEPAAHSEALSHSTVTFLASIFAALLLPVSSWAAHSIKQPDRIVVDPIQIAGATGPITPAQVWTPQFQGTAWEHRFAYVLSTGRVIELYRNEYYEQSQGKELISHGSHLFNPESFAEATSNVAQLSLDGLPPLEVNVSELVDRSGRRWRALHTYIVGRDAVADARRTQFLTAIRSLYGQPTAGVLAVMTLCTPSCDEVDAILKKTLVQAHGEYSRRIERP